jgi:hypothetical protein
MITHKIVKPGTILIELRPESRNYTEVKFNPAPVKPANTIGIIQCNLYSTVHP